MNAYIYQAAIYCEDCALAICKRLKAEGNRRSDDSDEWPLRSSAEGGGEADSPEHCDSGEDCLNAIDLADGRKIGAWLENDLTSEGVAYVREAVIKGGEVAELWALWYSDEL